MLTRRTFLATSAAASALAVFPRARAQTVSAAKRPHILLRSSWQVVNIGDIAHTPGVLALLEKHVPHATVTLWASGDLSDEVAAMEHKRFPNLRIVKGTITEGKPSNPALGEAVASADFLLHGSGPSMVGYRDVASFHQLTGKPFGVYGITYGGFGTAEKGLLSSAEFAYFRDSVSLAKARSDGITSPIMEFAPDGAFACDLRNEAAAMEFLKQHGLDDDKFVCCIPRLRYTPYWRIHNQKPTPEQEKRHARNEAMKEHDHAPLRETIVAVVRQTGMKVLICPEDMSQMAVGKEMLYDQLPDDVKQKTVWRESFWLTDEALSTYVRSAGLFGLEMHSPIMCIGNNVPAVVCRFSEQTSKGFMWRDVGLGDWLFDFDKHEDLPKLAPAVLDMLTNRDATKAKVAKAKAFVEQRQRETMDVVRKSLPA